jgi:hypothetical protein
MIVEHILLECNLQTRLAGIKLLGELLEAEGSKQIAEIT